MEIEESRRVREERREATEALSEAAADWDVMFCLYRRCDFGGGVDGQSNQGHPRKVHLVGSVPLSDTAEVFSRLNTLSSRLLRIPDGETGKRWYFVAWQRAVFAPAPFILKPFPLAEDPPQWKNVAPGVIKVNPTEFDDAAIASYVEFCKLRHAHVIAKETRFQVSLPTPANTICIHVDMKYAVEAEILYEAALLQSVRRIQDTIPKHDLAIQWDVAVEFGMLEHVPGFEAWFSPVKKGIVERITRVAQTVDKGVQLGFHLCYGDIAHKHFVEPKDSGLLVEMANLITQSVKRPVDWIHMPVPKDRTDREYYAPLKQLKLGKKTELYLGLVHPWDIEGTRSRIQVASDFVDGFGISTECGLGRASKQEFDSTLEVLAATG
ncbi:hypothetical protein B7494_g340 [Chlorociboria aeruginascens]|nr:hypothetical protein B7494_g340 [Chlorociboria aeruginascens]